MPALADKDAGLKGSFHGPLLAGAEARWRLELGGKAPAVYGFARWKSIRQRPLLGFLDQTIVTPRDFA